MQDLRILNLIHKRLSGDISNEELMELKSLEHTPEYQEVAQDIETIWAGSKDYFPAKKFDVAAAKAKFKEKIVELEPKPTPIEPAAPSSTEYIAPRNTASTTSNNSNLLKALVAAILLGIGGYAVYHFSTQATEQVEVITAEAPIEYAILEDQSEIHLKQGSVIKVHDFDNTNKRIVELDGEGYFEITKNPNKPFHVALPNEYGIEVLGTSFNVISDTGDGHAKVDVREGTVRVYHQNDEKISVVLTAGQFADIDVDNAEIQKDESSEIYSLIGTSISFKNEPLTAVFDKLSYIFNVDFEYEEGNYSQCKFNSPLIDSFEIDAIIELLSSSYPSLKFTPTGHNTYRVSGKACE